VRVAVLGAGGTIGPAIVADLAVGPEVDELTLLDRDGEAARAVAVRHGGGLAQAAAVDATDRQALALALEGHQVVVNAASYRTNLAAMDAALAADCSYLDLGGLYHVTAQQLRLGPAFAERGLVALLGCGAGPGKTNVMALRAAAGLDTVDAVRCSSAGLDPDPPDGLSAPYALATLLDELTLEPMVVRDGVASAIAPLTDGGTVAFPDPIGPRGSLYTLHSEVLTLPAALGARTCDFRLSLTPAVQEALLELVARPVEERAAVRSVQPSATTVSAQHVEVSGTRAGEAVTVTVTAVTEPDLAAGIGGGIRSTAAVAAAVVRLLARGDLRRAGFGVLTPEQALTPGMLFPELEARGCRFAVEDVAG
jgi:saccharopine dehydrogenase-like NADP-dependent oxidoreductase